MAKRHSPRLVVGTGSRARVAPFKICLQCILLLGLLLPLNAVKASATLPQLLSTPTTPIGQAVVGNGDSVSPWLSTDGRFVVFSSAASDLVTNDNPQPGFDVFMRDRLSNTTVLVSAATNGVGGGNGDSISGSASSNGQFVVFQSDASDLIAGDANSFADVFVRDVWNGITSLASVSTNGVAGNGASTEPVMTGDGRFVVFISAASDLVPGDTNGIPDVFVRDQLSQTTVLASVGAVFTNSTSNVVIDAVGITPDGRYVSFFSSARGMAFGVTNNSTGEIYVRDLVAATTTWVSSNATALVRSVMQFNSVPMAVHPVVSDDGRIVAFKCGWANVSTAPAGTKSATVLMRYDFNTGLISIVDTNVVPTWLQNDNRYGPAMTSDGRYLAFVSSNPVPAGVRVQLWDAQAGSNALVSVAFDGSFPTNTVSDMPAVSPDGRFVAFVSNATNLTANVVSNGFHVYLRDMVAGTTQLVDIDTNGVGSFECRGVIPRLTTNGALVAFSCREGGAINNSHPRLLQVFARDVARATNELISPSRTEVVSQSGYGLSVLSQFSLSDDGRRVVYASYAADLAANDGNATSDVFIYDAVGGSNILVSVGVDGNAASGGDSYSPALSSDGRFAVFVSTATNLVPERTNLFGNVYLRDLRAGSNVLVSVAADGISPGNGDSFVPSVSQDGRYVLFLTSAKNLPDGNAAGGVHVYLRDTVIGTSLKLTNGLSATSIPALSADGRYVAFPGPSAQLLVWDTQLGARIFTNSTAVSSMALSPTGARLLFTTSTALFAVDLVTKSNLFSIPTRIPIRNPAAWSADGRFFTFVTGTNAVVSDLNGTNDVYVCDLVSNTLSLVSFNSNLTASANGIAEEPAISGDGRFVAYRSFASDVVSGNTASLPSLFMFDRITGSNSLLSVAATVAGWGARISKPSLSGDGSRVVFQSWSSSLASLDLNRAQDIFGAVLSPWGNADTDGDGLPDLWMTQYFGHTTGQAGDRSRAQDDADSDGMNNLDEFLAGTSPVDAGSTLRLQIAFQTLPTGSAVLTWQAVPGKSYRAQFKNSLADSEWLETSGVSVVGMQGTFPVLADQLARFYRVVAN